MHPDLETLVDLHHCDLELRRLDAARFGREFLRLVRVGRGGFGRRAMPLRQPLRERFSRLVIHGRQGQRYNRPALIGDAVGDPRAGEMTIHPQRPVRRIEHEFETMQVFALES